MIMGLVIADEVAALVRLLETGEVLRGTATNALVDRWAVAQWVSKGRRNRCWELRPIATKHVRVRLTELCGHWESEVQNLRLRGLDPYDPYAWRSGKGTVGDRPRLLMNNRNWRAASGYGPKHRSRGPAPGKLTSDWCVRFRPHRGFRVTINGQPVDFFEMAKTHDECTLTERASFHLSCAEVEAPRLIITCENIGPYIDLEKAEDTLIVHASGTDTVPAAYLLSLFPLSCWIHFGDLDPRAVASAERLAQSTGRELALYVPAFLDDYLPRAARSVKAPWRSVPSPALVPLASARMRVFQEVFMSDPRLVKDLSETSFAASELMLERHAHVEGCS